MGNPINIYKINTKMQSRCGGVFDMEFILRLALILALYTHH